MARPTKYRKEYAEQARKLCFIMGATDAELAAFFEVSESTINNWKHDHPQFLESLKAGKVVADSDVAERLYRRAMGWEQDAVKIVADAKTGADHAVPYVERYPPDTTACIFWLKNRRPEQWRDKQDVDLRTPEGIEIAVTRKVVQTQAKNRITGYVGASNGANGNGKP